MCFQLYTGITQASLSCLQLVQNAAARIITGSRKQDHIISILASLHWLPVHFQIDFKILLLTFKAPNYIKDLPTPYVPGCPLRSADSGFLVIPRARLVTKGNQAFAVRAPKFWNNLPAEIRFAE